MWPRRAPKMELILIFEALFLVNPPVAGAASLSGRVHCTLLSDDRNVVVYLEKDLDRLEVDFTPPEEPVVMDQIKMRFVPHVLPILQGTRVAFPNSDEIRHSVFSPSEAKRFNLGMYRQGAVRYVVFDRPGEVALLCNVHPEMSAYIIVTPTPFFAVTDDEGRFQIEDIPSGRYLVRTWHEKLAPISLEVDVAGPSTNLELELTQ